VIRKMTVREKGRVLDFPDTRTIRMTDDELSILIEDEIPGKVITVSMYFLAAWSKEGQRKKARETKGGECEQQMPKRNRAQPMNSLKDESTQSVQVETVLEDSELEASKEHEIGDGEWEDPSAEHMRDKATRADGAAIPYHLWNDRVADKLEEFWKSEGYKNPQPTKRKDGSPGRQGASTKPKLNFKDPLDRLKLSRVLRTL
jgi:hypothetical protein